MKRIGLWVVIGFVGVVLLLGAIGPKVQSTPVGISAVPANSCGDFGPVTRAVLTQHEASFDLFTVWCQHLTEPMEVSR